jgi:hypothetical protein
MLLTAGDSSFLQQLSFHGRVKTIPVKPVPTTNQMQLGTKTGSDVTMVVRN